MTATDELRRMLKERGVEWWAEDDPENPPYYLVTKWFSNANEQTFEEIPAIRSRSLKAFCITPAQAVEATLGRGECQECYATKQNYKRCKYSTNRGWCDGECELHDCEGSFSAVNKPVYRCDCGAFMTQYTDATTYHKPRYCPNCGRKVKQ